MERFSKTALPIRYDANLMDFYRVEIVRHTWIFIMICMKCGEIHSRKVVKIIQIITHPFRFITYFNNNNKKHVHHMKIGDAQ